MGTITEDYVSFETAKLLKEKGFDEQCHWFYKDKSLKFCNHLAGRNSYQHGEIYTAPTHQLAMKWLRKKYRLFIAVAPFSKIDGCFYYSHTILHLHNSKCDTEYKSDGFNSPEEAIEDALQYCLTNLI